MVAKGMSKVICSMVIAGAAISAPVFASTFNLEHEHVPNQLIVKFKNPHAEFVESRIAAMSAVPVRQFESGGARLIQFTEEASDRVLLQRAKQLAMMPGVEYVEANTILRAAEVIPNDTDFGMLYGMKNTGQDGGVAGADIKATQAWGISTGSRNVLVGVIDTGIDYTHPDLAANMWSNPGETGLDAAGKDKSTNGVDDDNNGYVDDFRGWDFVNNDNDPMDDNKHGTHCAGTIGAQGNDGVGVVGVNWQVSLVGLKFLSGSGSGTLEGAVQAIEYGNKIGVTLTSNSWGGGGFSQTMYDAIKGARDGGILFVAAAGNDSANNDSNPHYPSSYDLDNVIAVAATDNKDAITSFSCYGLTSVDLAAPGAQIHSTIPGNQYAKLSGTSMATPHVSGVAALVKAVHPNATYAEIRDRILNGTDAVPALASKVSSGGRLNAYNALEVDTVAPAAPGEADVVSATRDSVSLSWQGSGDDGTDGVAKSYDVRYAETPIDSAADWAAANRAAVAVSVSAGNVVSATISGLPLNYEGYLAVQARDNVGNTSDISASVAFAVRKVTVVLQNDGSSIDGFSVEGTWAVEEVGGLKGFSDSPAGTYKENANVSMTSGVLSIPNSSAMLMIGMKYTFEAGYDFGHVEISVDQGATWLSLDKVTSASAGVVNKTYDLADKLNGKTEFMLRFRVTSDYSVNQDGWFIDSLAVLAAQ